MGARLDEGGIANEARTVPLWTRRQQEIRRRFQFKDFREAMAFVNRVAELAESANHHPDIEIRWNQVALTLSTHSEKGLTSKDFALARAIDGTAG